MKLLTKIKNFIRALRQSWGTPTIKRNLWNREFADGRWDFIENTANDFVYPVIEKYAKKGRILDLGCGSGNTGNELEFESYSEYVGVDISDVALEKAKLRSQKGERSQKNRYEASDICAYCPQGRFEVILFRESIYYIPSIRIEYTLLRYCKFLCSDGVFVIRWHDVTVAEDLLKTIGTKFRIVERFSEEASGALILVISPIDSFPTDSSVLKSDSHPIQSAAGNCRDYVQRVKK